jgi:phenylalanyl-tRNA synthetase beta chain
VLTEGGNPGDDIKKVLGFDEHVCEFEITSNRPDCLSVIGLARESAATFRTGFSVKEPAVKGNGGDIGKQLSVSVEAPTSARATARKIVRNIKSNRRRNGSGTACAPPGCARSTISSTSQTT